MSASGSQERGVADRVGKARSGIPRRPTIEVASGNGPDQVGIDPIARIRADPPDLFDVRWQLRRREQSREVLTGQLVDAGIVHISQ